MISEQRITLSNGPHAQIAYHVAGDGPAAVLLHGWGTSWYLWQDTMTVLAAEGYRVYAPDHIGCGASSKPKRLYTPQDHDAYLHSLLNDLHVERCILVGHSLGGHIAMVYALNHPERVERLVLVAPTYSPLRQITPTRAELMLVLAGIPLLGEIGLALAPVRLLRWVFDQPWGGFHRPDRLPREFLDSIAADYLLHASPLVCNTTRYLFLFSLPGLARLRSDADLLPHVARLAAPALLVWGEHDTLLRPDSYPLLASRLPNAIARPLADAGHTPIMEAPAEFRSILLDFLHQER